MLWSRAYTFQEIGFNASTVNGFRVREADAFVKWVCFNWMRQDMPELRTEDINQFEFAVDWVLGEVYVTEGEYEFAY